MARASHIVEQGLHRLQQPPHNVPASWFEHARRRYREATRPDQKVTTVFNAVTRASCVSLTPAG